MSISTRPANSGQNLFRRLLLIALLVIAAWYALTLLSDEQPALSFVGAEPAEPAQPADPQVFTSAPPAPELIYTDPAIVAAAEARPISNAPLSAALAALTLALDCGRIMPVYDGRGYIYLGDGPMGTASQTELQIWFKMDAASRVAYGDSCQQGR